MSSASITKDHKKVILLKYWTNFQGTFEMPLIKCEINLMLTVLPYYFVINSTDMKTFAIADTNLYFSVITLPTQGNTALLEQINQDSNEQSTGAKNNHNINAGIKPVFGLLD